MLFAIFLYLIYVLPHILFSRFSNTFKNVQFLFVPHKGDVEWGFQLRQTCSDKNISSNTKSTSLLRISPFKK